MDNAAISREITIMLARRKRAMAVWVCFLSFALFPLGAEDRAKRVREDLEDVLAGGRWIYNDLPRGMEEARASGKPLLVVIRCIPCDACRGFDEQVAKLDSRVERLLDRFVRVRIPQGNGLDLSLFQFDYDLSFYAFFLNADRTIYGRFGTRSTQEDKTGDVSMDAFRETLLAVLDLHAKYPQVKDSLKGKTGPAPGVRFPEEMPAFKDDYKKALDYEGNVVKSCIHCHQIREAERTAVRARGHALPDELIRPWPHPEVFGMHLDPRRRAAVARIEKDSAADRAGIREGDELLELDGQPIVSMADVQWVLEHARDEVLPVRLLRGKEEVRLRLPLEKGWRKRSEISWRASTWDLRRMATGGLLLESLSDDERRKAGVPAGKLGLRVEHAGEYGEHATAKQAGIRKGDIIVAVDGRTDPMTETDLIAYAVQEKKPGEMLEVTFLRGGERKTVSFSTRK